MAVDRPAGLFKRPRAAAAAAAAAAGFRINRSINHSHAKHININNKQDVNGAFLEEPMVDDVHHSNNNWTSLGTGGGMPSIMKQEGGGGGKCVYVCESMLMYGCVRG